MKSISIHCALSGMNSRRFAALFCAVIALNAVLGAQFNLVAAADLDAVPGTPLLSAASATPSTPSTSSTPSALSNPAANNSSVTSGSGILSEKALRIDPSTIPALELLKQDKEDEAKIELNAQLKKGNNSIDFFELLALLEFKSGNYAIAAKHLQIVLADVVKSGDLRRHAQLLKRIGDCYYNEDKVDQALVEYSSALELCKKLPPNDCLTAQLAELVMGCYVQKKDLKNAEIAGKQLLEVAKLRAQSGQLSDGAPLLWALVQLMDIYRQTGNDAQRLPLRDMAIALFNKFTAMRVQMEAENRFPPLVQWRKEFLAGFVKENNPQSVPEYLWLASDYRLRTPPLISWTLPTDQKARAALLCVHGLGLDNRAFDTFARRMVKDGYLVFAMDVRGFGSWVTSPGHETLQFERTLSDIEYFVQLIKEKNNSIPVFLVGESMGGAIALRAASRYGEIVDGVIASVPSAERFQERIMSLKVAYHFMQDPKRPFYVGEMVAEKATSRSELQASWKADPKAKMNLSPLELMKFAVFMRTTESDCKLIKKMPVFIVQGLKDKLVKPHGTYQLFDAIQSDDKTMTIMGNAEHLILETDAQSDVLLETLNAWLQKHLPAQSSSRKVQGTI